MLGVENRTLTIRRPSVTQGDSGGNVYGDQTPVIATGLAAPLVNARGQIAYELQKREIVLAGMFVLDEDPCHRSLGRAKAGDTVTDDRGNVFMIEAVEDVSDQGTVFNVFVRAVN